MKARELVFKALCRFEDHWRSSGVNIQFIIRGSLTNGSVGIWVKTNHPVPVHLIQEENANHSNDEAWEALLDQLLTIGVSGLYKDKIQVLRNKETRTRSAQLYPLTPSECYGYYESLLDRTENELARRTCGECGETF